MKSDGEAPTPRLGVGSFAYPDAENGQGVQMSPIYYFRLKPQNWSPDERPELGRGVRTMQRWESELGLPVHRPRGKDRSAVLAFPEELDHWLHSAPLSPDADGKRDAGVTLLQIALNLQTLGEQIVVPPIRGKARS